MADTNTAARRVMTKMRSIGGDVKVMEKDAEDAKRINENGHKGLCEHQDEGGKL